MLRNGEQLLLAVVIPVIVLIGGVDGADHVGLHLSHPAVDVFTPGVLALAVMSTAFTSLAIATGFERRYGVIKRLGSSPLPRSGLLAGKIGGLLARRGAPDRGDLGGRVLPRLGPGAGGAPRPSWPSSSAPRAFAALGLFVAGVLRAEATLAAANLIYLLLLAGGAVVLPTSSYGALRPGRRAAARRARSGTPCAVRSSMAPPPGATCWCCSSGRPSAAFSPRGRSDGSEHLAAPASPGPPSSRTSRSS